MSVAFVIEGVVDSAMYKVKFKLTDIEYQWPLVRVYASRRQWDRLDQLMVQKGFLSSAASSIMGGVGMGSNSSVSWPISIDIKISVHP